ncbi:hypothetical protein [Microbispora bryophytorum]|uniref:hypothetical protein n=1 Tax=Microbispora bryophytorum TaxID=1460882 RepID=UPI0033D88572
MSLKERLASRARPTFTYRLRVDDTADAEKALSDAYASFQFASISGDTNRIDTAKKVVTDAEKALDACYEPIVLTAMKPDEFEALVDGHPVRPNTDDEAWNMDTFPKACFLACAPADLSADEWEGFLSESCSDGERTALFNAAIAINVRIPDPTVPKGLTEILG